MPVDANNLIWIDMEMTGLQPDADRIIEIAVLITNAELEIIAAGPVMAVHQPDEVLAAMDSWNQSTHRKTGLIDRVRASRTSEAEAERRLVEFLDLPWNEKCVDFHKSERPVKTASVAQVRRPIYGTSVARWKKFGSGLQPLLDALGVDVQPGAERKTT